MTASRVIRWSLWLAWGATLLFGGALDPSCGSVLSALALNCSSSVCVAIVASSLVAALGERSSSTSRPVLRALALGGFVATVLRLSAFLGSPDASVTVPGRIAQLVSLAAWSSLGPTWAFADLSHGLSQRCLALHQAGLYLLHSIGFNAQLFPRPSAPWSPSDRLLYVVVASTLLLVWWVLGLRAVSAPHRQSSPGLQERTDAAWPDLSSLTQREREVLTAVLHGEKQVDVARRLGLSPSTVSTYRRRACEKLGLDTSAPLRAREPVPAVESTPPERHVSPVVLLVPFLLIAAGSLCARVDGACGRCASALFLQVMGAAALVLALMRSFADPPAHSEEGGLGPSSTATVLVASLLLGLSARYLLSFWEPRVPAMASCAVLAAMALLMCRRKQCLALPPLNQRARQLAASAFSCALVVGSSPRPADGTVAVAGVLSLDPSLALSLSLAIVTVASPFALRLLCVGRDQVDASPHRLDSDRPLLYLRGRGLSEVDAHILVEIARGRSTPEICRALHVSEGSVNTARFKAYRTLGIHSRRELVEILLLETGAAPGPVADGRNA